jgi:hypothetical protein
MDNKQDRQFYWEVKDFMGRNNVLATPAPQKPNVVSSVKNILEQNKLYKQSSFSPNINSANTIRQAISSMENIRANGTPNTKAFTKNIASNPFKVIKEGVFDDVNAEIENYAKQSGMSPSATPDELESQISQQQVKPGVPLTAQQKATRDLQGALVRKQAVQQQMEKEARVQSGQTKIDPKTGNEFSPKPQFQKDREQQAAQTPKTSAPVTPATPTPYSERGDGQPTPTTPPPSGQGNGQPPSSTPSQPTQKTTPQPTPAKPKDEWNWRQHSSDENKAHGRQVEAERNRADAQKTPNYYSSKDQVSGSPTDHALAARNKAEQKLANGEPLDANDKFYFQYIGKGANNTNQTFTNSQGQSFKGLATSGTKMTPEQIQAESQRNLAKKNTPAVPGVNVEGPPAPTSGTPNTQTTSPGAVRGPGGTTPPKPSGTTPQPGSTPAPAGQGTSLGLKISDGVPSTPAPQTGGQVNAKVREQLGLGSTPAPAPASSPGQEGARNTLGLGSTPAPAPAQSPGEQGARNTLGIGTGKPPVSNQTPAPAPQSKTPAPTPATPAPATPAPAPSSGGIPTARETLGLGPAPANNSSEETDAQKRARQTLMSK